MSRYWYTPKGCLRRIISKKKRVGLLANGIKRGEVFILKLSCGHTEERMASDTRNRPFKSAHCNTCYALQGQG